ncbi:MAG: TVP38/TMEM64 family protein [Acaryochloridaceae cyanobacterium CSU_3_4]|nr:TVP38/TMEM64 family protein [Acaryochloridaceae cyanobacterium CSU_3_4]
MQQKITRVLELSLIVLLIAGTIWWVNRIGIDQIRSNIAQFGIWAPLILGLLRWISIVVPLLPGTAYALLAGALFGFAQGLLIIAIADFLACNTNFWIARRYGRGVVARIVGKRFMDKLDRGSKKHLESNFFLLTGVLMSSFFDYISYAAGLSCMSGKRFLSALGLSIVLIKPPVVAVGASLIQGDKVLIFALVVGMFGLAILSAWLRRKSAPASQDQ